MDQGDQYSHVSSSSEPDTNTIAGIVIGILSALLVLVILVSFFGKPYQKWGTFLQNFLKLLQVVLVLYRHFFVKGSDTMNFDNPVYRKTTTEDRISIEKNRYNKSLNNGGGHGGFNNSTSSSITISDEVNNSSSAGNAPNGGQSYPLASSIIFHGTLAKLAKSHSNPRPYSLN